VTCKSYEEIISSIRDLTVRGAPAIGVAAAMGAALGALRLPYGPQEKFRRDFFAICDEIAKARPTARNLFWALERMKKVVDRTKKINQNDQVTELINEARRIYSEDIEINRQIGKYGSLLLDDRENILTHCNAGALATVGYGTALGVIRAAREAGKFVKVIVPETRPALQGARLTAFELVRDGFDCRLISDTAVGHTMSAGLVDKVVVGADRITKDGWVFNKIGTYQVAVLAKRHGVPFYPVAPRSTFDLERTHREVRIE